MGRIDAQLETTRSNAGKLEERERNYRELVGLLSELPEKVSHPIMVPFGPLAFFPGCIERTNEVLTQLSSEYFVLRTTKRASELASKRLHAIERERAALLKNEGQLEMMRGLAAGEEASASASGATVRRDDQGFMDIREPYDEREEQQQAAAASSATVAVARQPPAGGGDVDVLERLRALERQEEMEEEGYGAEDEQSGHPEQSGDALARLRELERLEEMEELDSVIEQAEQQGNFAEGVAPSFGEGMPAAVTLGNAASGSTPPPERVLSPSDLFLRMRQVEEGAITEGRGAAEEVQLSAPVSASASAAPRRPVGAAPLAGGTASRGVAAAATGCSPAAGLGDCLSPLPPPPPGTQAVVRERLGAQVVDAGLAGLGGPPASAPAEEGGSPAAGSAPKRVSKFKSERQRGLA